MPSLIHRWLAEQIASLDSVQKCVLGSQEASIIVHSWNGVLINVHVVDEPIKTRTLKKMAQEATRVGVGTLCVINAALLPPDGVRLLPPEWLLSVHALTDNKIYAYRIDQGQPVIFQVHFKIAVKLDERDVWYGPEIEIGKLPFYRVWVKTPALKGDFLIANFAADPFWHNRDYRNQRAAKREQERAERSNGRAHYEYGYHGYNPGELVQKQQTPLESSYAALGLKPGVPCEEVKSAFRKLARETHPDVSTLPKNEAESRFHTLTEAYTFIRDNGGCE